ncbi:hypothetical protein [Actinacidiphila sp. bgisy160]|uniref:hypothetical protein n=1 Tax=Actinacidiphila sp. bgisy160 TaxID=3413796 RepID=UPI003D7580F8
MTHTPEMVARRTALCLASGVDPADIEPGTGYDLSRNGYDSVRASWIAHITMHGHNEQYGRPSLRKAFSYWAERRPEWTAGDDWEATGLEAHRAYWDGTGRTCNTSECLGHGREREALSLVMVDGSDEDGPYPALTPTLWVGTEGKGFRFTRATAEDIVRDLNACEYGLTAEWHGEVIRMSWDASYEPEPGDRDIAPDADGLYDISGWWPWDDFAGPTERVTPELIAELEALRVIRDR